MTFGLDQRDREKIIQAMERFKEIDQAIIFGSRAKGNQKKGSDVDLAIKGKQITYQSVNRIRSFLNEELALPYFFDVIHYEEITDRDLIDHINRVGEVFYPEKH